MFTLEASRSGSGVLAAYAKVHLFGRIGLHAIVLGHLVEMAERKLREHLEGHDSTLVAQPQDGIGMVTKTFRVYPDGVE